MISEAHENLIDIVARCVVRDIAPHYGKIGTLERVGFTTEHSVATALMSSLRQQSRHADAYIWPGDDSALILLEVGNMKDGKWAHLADTDGAPVRVLRIGFDGTCWILHPRHTDFEAHLLREVAAALLHVPYTGRGG